ncbi:MAG: phospholipase D family protein [Burkholderiaceae bacterium]|nr:phospholipase D family protein [Burkholderiaceae bacterium]
MSPMLQRALSHAALAFTFAVLAGCAGLPRDVQRTPSQAIAASPDTELGRIALASAPDRTRSGFRLLSWWTQSLQARIELIRRAQVSLDVQYYVIHDDVTGRHLLRALRDAAGRGVRVRLLVDDLYTAGLDPLLLGLAAQPNAEVRLFNPFPVGRNSLGARLTASLLDLGRVNHRMHNKLLVADGAMAVAGGRNIGDEYFMAHGDANYIDLDAFVVGPAVAQLAASFDLYWNSEHVFPLQSIVPPDRDAAGLRERFERWTDPARAPPPQPAPKGEKDLLGQRHVEEELAEGRIDLHWAEAQVFADVPEKVMHHSRRWLPRVRRDEKTVRHGLMRELLLARKEVMVSSPYLVPNPEVIEDIREGRIWGLQIKLITNSLASTDEPLVHAGYQRYRRQMVDLGVELYEVAPSQVRRAKDLGPFGQSVGRFHAKAAAIDGHTLFIGSLNFDPRSEKFNTELGLLIRSPVLTGQLMKLADLVITQAAYRVRLSKDKRDLEWVRAGPDGRETVLDAEPDTSPLERWWLWLIGPLVPDDVL